MTTFIYIFIIVILIVTIFSVNYFKKIISELKQNIKEVEKYALHLQKQNRKLMKENTYFHKKVEGYTQFLKEIDPDASTGIKRLF